MKKVKKIDINKILIMTYLLILLFSILNKDSVVFASKKGLTAEKLEPLVGFVNYWLKVGAFGATLLALLAFVSNIIKVGISSTNTGMRQEGIRGLIISGIAAMITPILGLILNLIISIMT